ncbi:MAG TPA: hypothetical protein VGQ00_03490 [Candidatus Norongarragalinales archaeon]|jgi:hypothetical protein|nr:hypothetical protein [Candidatus Norongarragalinales archaeon]
MSEKLETVIDKLMELVEKEGSVSTTRAGKALGLLPSQVERMAALMEQSGLVTLQFGITGPVISKVRQPQKASKTRSPREAKQDLMERAKSIERDILGGIDVLRFTEDEITMKLKHAERNLEKLREGDMTQEQFQVFKHELFFIEQQMRQFKAERKKLEDKESAFVSRIQRVRDSLDHVKPQNNTQPSIFQHLNGFFSRKTTSRKQDKK